MATFVNDTFTDTDTTLLGSHTGETGATWTRSVGSGQARITGNRVYVETTSGWTASGSPLSPDYYVEGVLRTGTLAGSPTNRAISLLARNVGQDNYELRVNEVTDAIAIRKIVGQVQNHLDSGTLVLSAATDYTIKFEVAGTTLTGYVDGVQAVQVTDTALSAAGKAGLYSTSNLNPTTDLLWASLVAVDLSAPPSPPAITSISPTSGDVNGGTTVVITGTNLSSVNQVSFGSAPAASFTIDSATQITAVSPAGIASTTVDVIASTAAGSSANTAADNFTYNPPASPWVPSTVHIHS